MEDTRKHSRIVAAAAALFAKYGYRKTTIDEIVAGAGVSKGLFYHYFSNKKQLYLYIYNSYVDMLSRSIKENVDTTESDFIERLKRISHIRIAFINQYPDLWGFLYSSYYEKHPDVESAIKDKNKELLQASYAGSAANIDWSKLNKSISPDEAIMLVTWIAEGFVQRLNTDSLVLEENLYAEFDKYIDLLKNGLYGN